MPTRFFDNFQLTALACLVSLAVGRASMLYARGVHVLAIDRQRTLWQGLVDLLALVIFLAWGYESVAYAWPLERHVFPAALGTLVVDAVGVKMAGVVIVLAGLLIFALALRAFADSWRIGIDRDRPGALMTGGIFASTRNPIYVALDLIISGTFLVLGRAVFLPLALALAALLHHYIRREETFLAGTYGDAYRDYCARVGRYVTWR